jgi:hypothetical protein
MRNAAVRSGLMRKRLGYGRELSKPILCADSKSESDEARRTVNSPRIVADKQLSSTV